MSARHSIRRRWRTDWFRVLADLQYRGWSNERVAESIGVPRGTLRGWKAGSEPSHCDGQRLLVLWSAVTHLGLESRGMAVGKMAELIAFAQSWAAEHSEDVPANEDADHRPMTDQ